MAEAPINQGDETICDAPSEGGPICHGPTAAGRGRQQDRRSGSGPERNGDLLKKKIFMDLTGGLPPLPQIVIKAQEIISDPGSGLKELANVIAMDQALAVRVLKLANSAYYGLAGRVTSIGHAAVLLGGKILGEVVIMAGTINLLNRKLNGYGFDSGELWRHSLAVGVGSRLVARRSFPDLAADAFSAGIIHDTGKIMLDEHIREIRDSFEEFTRQRESSFLKAEQEILGFDHAEIGAEICKTWGIPEPLTRAIRYHHAPFLAQDRKLASIVHTADYIALSCGYGGATDTYHDGLDEKAVKLLGLGEETVPEIKEEVGQIVEKLSSKIL